MKRTQSSQLFPADFLWGASISAHQTEGGNHNQWSVWELENAKALASMADYQQTWLPKWQVIRTEAITPENYVSGRAVDHYKLYKHDFDLLKKLNMNSLRFSIEWSRIQPHGPQDWNHDAVQHYRDYLQALRLRGIEPVVTLWHFTHPVWFAEKGGFEKYDNIQFFIKFADRIMRELGRDIRFVITINEPDSYIYNSYKNAVWPPQKQQLLLSLEVYRNMLIAHKFIYKKLQKHRRPYQISFAKTYSYVYTADDRFVSKLSAWFHRFTRDWFVLYRVHRQMDFIAVNYYFADRYRGLKVDNPNKRQNDLGWDMQPTGIKSVIAWLHKTYKKPIMITENGLADADDKDRRWWIEQTITAMAQAQKSGANLIGYLHWSLTDNFEWAQGRWPRFGLFGVDYKMMKRSPRKSALWFAGVIKKLRSL